jgi:uncharacterized phage protein gp47/JayE
VTTLADLITPSTRASELNALLATMAAEGLPVTAWQAGNPLRTLSVADAEALRDLRGVVSEIARGGYLDSAEEGWLTLLAASVFDTTRVPSQYNARDITVTCAAGAGPYTITPAQLVVSDGTRRWQSTNTSNVTIPSGGSVAIRVRAEEPGDAYNVSGASITTLVAPALAGLTVLGGATIDAGAPEESDATLRLRCRTRWGTLGRGATTAAYEFWALSTPGAEAVRRVLVVPGPGDGTVAVYIAQAGATATAPQVSAVQTYIDTQRPTTDAPTVVAATEVPVSVTATVRVRTASDSTANRTAATDAIAALINATPLGGEIDREAIPAAIYRASAGIVDVDTSVPAADVVLTSTQVATVGAITITWVLA